ncbi:hypothetical protein [Thermocrinis sp.]
MSSFLKDLLELFHRISEKQEKKFLGIINQEGLVYLEKLLKIGLGVEDRIKIGKEPRKSRPFIGWEHGNKLYLCLLTTQRKGKHVDIGLCSRRACSKYRFGEDSFLFFDPKREKFFVYAFPKLDSKFYRVCGYCENLEHLEKIAIYEVGK